MQAFVTGALGALVVSGGLMAWNARAAAAPDTADQPQQTAAPLPSPVSSVNAPAVYAHGAAAPLSVRCEPGQQAVVRASGVPGTFPEVACVGAADEHVLDMRAAPRVLPASYAVAPAAAAPVPARVVYRDRETVRRPAKRSWKKRALVIGGSAGAGAGIGALAGGKKGALIGAAVGGGAASIYEAVKH